MSVPRGGLKAEERPTHCEEQSDDPPSLLSYGAFGVRRSFLARSRASGFLGRFQPGVFGLDQLVKNFLVKHAGFAEGRGRKRIHHSVMNFEAAFAVLDHSPLDQLLVAHDLREALEAEA